MSREDVTSPTVNVESTLLTAVIEAEEDREVATCDKQNACIQTQLEEVDQEGNRTIMKIKGNLIDIFCETDPSYKEYAIYENSIKVFFMHITSTIYGLMESAMLFYKKFSQDLIGYKYEINPYDPYVANKIVDGIQMAVSWHVDNVKVSHINSTHVDHFLEWSKKTYGAIGEVNSKKGKIHEYLGIKLD